MREMREMRETCEKGGINRKRTVPYHPVPSGVAYHTINVLTNAVYCAMIYNSVRPKFHSDRCLQQIERRQKRSTDGRRVRYSIAIIWTFLTFARLVRRALETAFVPDQSTSG